MEINSKMDCHRVGLRTRVQKPMQATNNAGIKKAFAEWVAVYNEYLDAGGATLILRSAARRS